MVHVSAQAQKKKKKNSYILGNRIPEQRSYIFSQKKLFLYLRKRKARKNSLYFRKRNSLIFQEATFQARKIKNTHFGKTSYISGNGAL